MSTAKQTSSAPHASYFQDLEQQAHASRLGMWIFLGSETLLFAALFGLYWSYRTMYAGEFAEGIHHNSAVLGTIMTAILLISSFFVAWGVHSIRHDRRRAAFWSLIVTIVLGGVFLGLKAYEYRDHFHHGIYPGSYYAFEELPGRGAVLFFTLYYFLTGLHALHVLAGMLLLGILAVLVRRGRFDSARYSAVDNGGLYWHLVDVVWIFLWPMLYLTG